MRDNIIEDMELEKRILNYNKGKGFLKTLRYSADNHNISGVFGIIGYLIRRISNYLIHILAQIFPFNKIRASLHRARGVRISKSAQIGARVWIDEAFPKYISIHDDAAISIGCKILAHSIPPISHNKRFGSYVAPVVIQKGVWVGAYSIILAGVTIGEGSIISVGSVVTNSIPPHSIARGNPAEVIGKLK
jgi:acetyltransferase-like isoleucine patch superfamily enzyme